MPLAISTRMRSPKYREPSRPLTASMASLHKATVRSSAAGGKNCRPGYTEPWPAAFSGGDHSGHMDRRRKRLGAPWVVKLDKGERAASLSAFQIDVLDPSILRLAQRPSNTEACTLKYTSPE